MSTRRQLVGYAVALTTIAGLTGQASAQSVQEEDWCTGKNNASLDQMISGCTALIQSGKQTPKYLANTFSNRGIAYYRKGQYERALQDFDQAIKLNPKEARLFKNRSVVREKKGDKAGAEADWAEARRIDPNIRP